MDVQVKRLTLLVKKKEFLRCTNIITNCKSFISSFKPSNFRVFVRQILLLLLGRHHNFSFYSVYRFHFISTSNHRSIACSPLWHSSVDLQKPGNQPDARQTQSTHRGLAPHLRQVHRNRQARYLRLRRWEGPAPRRHHRSVCQPLGPASQRRRLPRVGRDVRIRRRSRSRRRGPRSAFRCGGCRCCGGTRRQSDGALRSTQWTSRFCLERKDPSQRRSLGRSDVAELTQYRYSKHMHVNCDAHD